MRTILITSAIAASFVTAGFAASATAAQPDGADPVATPTTLPIDLGGLGDLGLTPDQLTCLTTNMGTVDLNDMTALMTLMTQCGINPMDLAAGADVPVEPTVGIATSLVPAVTDTATASAAIDPAAAASILLTLGIDPTSAQCIEDGLLAAASPGDDTEALAILQSCGLTLNDLLVGVLSLNELAAGSNSVVSPTASTLPAGPTTAAGVASDNPMAQQLIDMVRDQYGIELTPEQASCLLDNISSLDANDMAATVAVMEQCGINLTDLAG